LPASSRIGRLCGDDRQRPPQVASPCSIRGRASRTGPALHQRLQRVMPCGLPAPAGKRRSPRPRGRPARTARNRRH
jgi:hypothetical protein